MFTHVCFECPLRSCAPPAKFPCSPAREWLWLWPPTVGSVKLSLCPGNVTSDLPQTPACRYVAMPHRGLPAAWRSADLFKSFSSFVLLSFGVRSRNPCLLQEFLTVKLHPISDLLSMLGQCQTLCCQQTSLPWCSLGNPSPNPV